MTNLIKGIWVFTSSNQLPLLSNIHMKEEAPKVDIIYWDSNAETDHSEAKNIGRCPKVNRMLCKTQTSTGAIHFDPFQERLIL